MEWRARRDSNPRPQPPQGCALSELSYERARLGPAMWPPVCLNMVPKVGFEPTRPYGHCALNAARLPFRHFGPYLLSGGRYWTRTSDLLRVKHIPLSAALAGGERPARYVQLSPEKTHLRVYDIVRSPPVNPRADGSPL